VAAELALRQRDADEALKRYQDLLKRVAVEDRMVGDFSTALQASLQAGFWQVKIAPARPSPRVAHRSVESAVLTVSDCHCGKVIEPKHTLGFGHYNPRVYLDRLKHLETTVLTLMDQHIRSHVDRLYVLFLGDLVEGQLDHAEEIPQRTLMADQALLAISSLWQFLANLSRTVPLEVYGVGGNHARWPNQKKPPTAGRWSNWDMVVLGALEAMAQATGLDRVRFHLGEGAFEVFNIGPWRVKIGHGDHLKGGDKAMAIPAHAIGREINATTQRYASRNEQAPDYYLVGDKHRHLSVPTARGRYMINGAFFEADEYAMTSNFTPGRPHQQFFGLHPKVGQTWTYPIWLDLAPSGNALPYPLPGRLARKVAAYPGRAGEPS
jgi:predicted MPP superfamily phosphohydrolase